VGTHWETPIVYGAVMSYTPSDESVSIPREATINTSSPSRSATSALVRVPPQASRLADASQRDPSSTAIEPFGLVCSMRSPNDANSPSDNMEKV
jgi:hypothetical protein